MPIAFASGAWVTSSWAPSRYESPRITALGAHKIVSLLSRKKPPQARLARKCEMKQLPYLPSLERIHEERSSLLLAIYLEASRSMIQNGPFSCIGLPLSTSLVLGL